MSRSLRELPGVGVAWLAMRPRRRPRLGQVPRTAAFRKDRAAAAAWVDGQLRLIESAVSWLERAGLTVADECRLSLDSHGWVVSRSDRWHISCTRTVTAVYGANGGAASHIKELAAAVGAAGWACSGTQIPDSVSRLAELLLDGFQQQRSGKATAGWRPTGDAEPPPGWSPPAAPLAAKPPLSLTIRAEQAQPAWPRHVPEHPPPPGPQRLPPPAATPLYQPVELSETDTATLVKQASAHSRPRLHHDNPDYLSWAKPLAGTPEPAAPYA